MIFSDNWTTFNFLKVDLAVTFSNYSSTHRIIGKIYLNVQKVRCIKVNLACIKVEQSKVINIKKYCWKRTRETLISWQNADTCFFIFFFFCHRTILGIHSLTRSLHVTRKYVFFRRRRQTDRQTDEHGNSRTKCAQRADAGKIVDTIHLKKEYCCYEYKWV